MAVDLVIYDVRKVEMHLTGIVLELENGTKLNRKEILEYQSTGSKMGKSEIFYDAILGNVKVYYATHPKYLYDGVTGHSRKIDISDIVP